MEMRRDRSRLSDETPRSGPDYARRRKFEGAATRDGLLIADRPHFATLDQLRIKRS